MLYALSLRQSSTMLNWVLVMDTAKENPITLALIVAGRENGRTGTKNQERGGGGGERRAEGL